MCLLHWDLLQTLQRAEGGWVDAPRWEAMGGMSLDRCCAESDLAARCWWHVASSEALSACAMLKAAQ